MTETGTRPTKVKETMTPRERWLAAIRMQPVDRLPFWPKLNASYPIGQQPPFNDMTNCDIHNWIGSDKHEGSGWFTREIRTNTEVEHQRGETRRRMIYKAPSGTCTAVYQWDYPSQSWHPVDPPVKTAEDIKVMIEINSDIRLEVDKDQLKEARERVAGTGQQAVTTISVGKSPMMCWLEDFCGVKNGNYMLFDHQDLVEELFAVIHEGLKRKAEIIAENTPADLIYMTENTSTTLLSPEQYRKYSLGHVTDYGNIIKAAGKLYVLHMCGHLKAILPDLATTPADAFEAFTSPTLGNTTLLDGRSACPDKCLVGGTNAILWTRSAGEIIEQIERDLDSLPHHRGIVVTSAGVMPPLCRPDTIRQVCEWVKQYPVRT